MESRRVSNTKPLINKYNWKGIYYLSKLDEWKTFEKNNQRIALNILYIKEKEICPAYISNINSNCEKEIIILMIQNEEKEGWHYLAVKKTIYSIKRNNMVIFITWIVFILLELKINLNLMKKYVKIKTFVKF